MFRCEPVAIVGCGSIGRRHAGNLRSAGVQRLYVVDADRAAAARLAADAGAEACASLDEALSRGAASAFVCTPTNMHVEHAMRAVAADAHVFVEKPLSYSADEVAQLVALAEDRHVVTMVGCNMRFHPGPRAVKDLLIRSAIGQVVAVQRDYSRSCLVIGTDGTIEWAFRDREVRVIGEDGTVRERITEPADWDVNRMYQDEVVHFVDAVERRGQAENPIATAAATLRVALAARARSDMVTT
jgi:predicted dehydrogenase